MANRERRGVRIFQALPAYFGGKRRLCPLIFAELAKVLPACNWAGATFLDPSCGACSVALYAKALGFSVIASDLAERAVIVSRALIANSTVRLRTEDVLDLFRPPAGEYPRVAQSYSPSVFAPEPAAWLDRALARSWLRPEPLRSMLQLLVVKLALRCQPMSMLRGTDARAAATGDYDRVSPRRLGHYLRSGRLFTPPAVWSVARQINAGVFGGQGVARRGDAIQVVQETPAEVLYLDPPYPGTTAYGREYRVLDEMLGDLNPKGESIDLDLLLEAATAIPVVVLSYGGPKTELEELARRVGRHRQVRKAMAVPYRHLESIASEERNAKEREYLVIACR